MDAKMLARVHRIRDLQVTLAQGEEARARDKAEAEAELGRRIAALADAVAPRETRASAVTLGAEAHFRTRLQASSQAAEARLANAQRLADRAAEATRAARQDRSAVEKLLDRARRDAIAGEMRALEDMPAGRKTAR